MKKITFILLLFLTSISFSQNLVANGDFQLGTGPNLGGWYGNASNAVDLGGGNIVNQAEVTVAGPPYNVNLSQEIVLDNTKTYRLTFDAFTDSTTGTRTMVVGLGQAAAPWGALTQTTTLTSTSQTFTYQFTINYGDAVTDRVIFDMGAATGFVFIDNVSVEEIVNTCTNGVQDGDETGIDCGGSCSPCPVPPNTPAPTPPARAAADVANIYSAAYGSQTISGSNFDVPSNTSTWSEESVSGDSYWAITNSGNDFVGFNFGANVDASQMTHFHMDYWTTGTPTGGVINIKMSQHDAGFSSGETDAAIYLINPPGADGQWNSVDVEITAFTTGILNDGITTRDFLSQMVITASGAGGAFFDNIYFDNVYFHNNTVLGVEEFNKTSFEAYPNPSNASWTIKSKNIAITSVTVFDVLGKRVVSLSPNNTKTVIDGSNLKPGLYFAQIKTNNGSSSVKLVKQ